MNERLHLFPSIKNVTSESQRTTCAIATKIYNALLLIRIRLEAEKLF